MDTSSIIKKNEVFKSEIEMEIIFLQIIRNFFFCKLF